MGAKVEREGKTPPFRRKGGASLACGVLSTYHALRNCLYG
jgi:hypothetical protein